MRLPLARSLCVLSAAALFLLYAPASAAAALVTVTVPDDSGPGSLREAINTANAGDEITFDSGLSGQTITLAAELDITVPLTITGPGARNLTISGNNVVRVFQTTHSTGDVVIEDLTIQDGDVIGFGGGVYNAGQSSLRLIRCAIKNNTADGGGGVATNLHGSSVLIDGCTISNNLAPTGIPGSGGGGIFASSLTSLTILNSTIADNQSMGKGGGISSDLTVVKIINSTIVHNIASTRGGGIQSGGSGTDRFIGNTIICGNQTGLSGTEDIDTSDAFTSLGGNYIGMAPSSSGFTNGTLQDQVGPPGFSLTLPVDSVLANNGGPTDTYALLYPSSAVDAGVQSLLTDANFPNGFANDQRGDGFPRHGLVDIGAVETDPQTLTVNTDVDENDGITTNSVSLRDAVAYAPADSTIDFAPELIGDTLLFDQGYGAITINRPIKIEGFGARALTISGVAAGGVFVDTHPIGSAEIRGLTITGGNIAEGGAILHSSPGPLLVAECAFTGNIADEGAAISSGGGGTQTTLERCTISGNHANFNGGGVMNRYGSTMLISNCTISGNGADVGGAVVNVGGALTVVNSTIVLNTARACGGIDSFDYSGTVTMLGNTVVGGNTETIVPPIGPEIAAPANGITSLGGNYVYQMAPGLGLTDGVNGDQVETRGGFVLVPVVSTTLADNGGPTDTHDIIFPSRAVGKGNDALRTSVYFPSSPGNDQRGQPRHGHIDIGAVEAEPDTINVTISTDEDDGVAFGDGISLREAVSEIIEGGAISFDQSHLTLGDLVIDHGMQIDGNLISSDGTSRVAHILNGANVTMNRITITGGVTPGSGGGIFNDKGTLNLFQCTLTGNSAAYGGGLSSYGPATVNIDSCTISGNHADQGVSTANFSGGLDNFGGSTMNVSNSTISGNFATKGGGILTQSADVNIFSCTIVNNAAAIGGAGAVGVDTSGVVTIGDSLIQANTDATGAETDIVDAGFTSIGGNYIGAAGAGTGLTNSVSGDSVGTLAAPLAVAFNPVLANNGGPTMTHMLLYPGPAVDTGVQVLPATVTTDQRGSLRIFGGHIDIGAVEWAPFVPDGLPDDTSCEQAAGLRIAENAGWLDVTFQSDSNPVYILFSASPGAKLSVRGRFDAASWDRFFLDDGTDTGFYDSTSTMYVTPQPQDQALFVTVEPTGARHVEVLMRKAVVGGRRTFVSVVEFAPGSGSSIISQFPMGTGPDIERSEYLPVITGYDSCTTDLSALKAEIIDKLRGIVVPPTTQADTNGDMINDSADATYLDR